MTRIALASLAVLAACANAPAQPNPNSVPSIQQTITQTRTTSNYIYITGGVNDGAAIGQTTTLTVTPDDRVVCTFQQGPVVPQDGPLSVVTGHRTVLPGAYATLSAMVLPNVPAQGEVLPNFTIETAINGLTSTSGLGSGDPRFEPVMQYFLTTPSPCWAFG